MHRMPILAFAIGSIVSRIDECNALTLINWEIFFDWEIIEEFYFDSFEEIKRNTK